MTWVQVQCTTVRRHCDRPSGPAGGAGPGSQGLHTEPGRCYREQSYRQAERLRSSSDPGASPAFGANLKAYHWQLITSTRS